MYRSEPKQDWRQALEATIRNCAACDTRYIHAERQLCTVCWNNALIAEKPNDRY